MCAASNKLQLYLFQSHHPKFDLVDFPFFFSLFSLSFLSFSFILFFFFFKKNIHFILLHKQKRRRWNQCELFKHIFLFFLLFSFLSSSNDEIIFFLYKKENKRKRRKMDACPTIHNFDTHSFFFSFVVISTWI